MSTPDRKTLTGTLILLLASMPVASLAADRVIVLEHYTNFR